MIKKILFVFVLLVVAAPVFAFAQINLNLDYPTFAGIDLNTNQNLNQIVAWLYYFIIGIAGLAAFVMIVWGGIQWLTSGAIPSQASEARDKLRAAILGLLLVLASFLIIQVINPQLTLLNQPGLTKFFGTVPSITLQGPGPGCAPQGAGALGFFIFEHNDFTGSSLEIICVGTPNHAGLAPVGGNAISSIRYDPQCEVDLFLDENYQGVKIGVDGTTVTAYDSGGVPHATLTATTSAGGLAEANLHNLGFPPPPFLNNWGDKISSLIVISPADCLR